MKKAWVYFVIAMTVVSCLAVGGCKKAAEKAIENKLAREGVDAKVDSSGGKMTIQTKDGTTVVTGGKDAKVPENFPKDVYVYEGATIRGSVSVPNGFNLVMETGDSADDALGTGEPKRDREAKQFEAAKRFLEQSLSTGPMPSNRVKARAKESGISNATLWRAKDAMGIRASKERFTGEWFWRLA